MTTPARDRRQNQEIPATATAAALRFKCEAYLCTLDGEKCRDQHVHAAKFKPMNRDACIDCPAGAARAILLGSGAGEAGQPAICTARTVKGLPCAHPPVEGGLCHIHRGAAAGSTPRAHAARKETRMRKKAAEKKPAPAKAKTPRPAPVAPARPVASARPVVPKKPAPAVVVADAAAVPSAAVTPATPVTCKRSGCERPAMGIGRLPEHCRWCRDSADMTVRKRVGRAGTVAELIEWLNRVPVHKHFRHPSGGAAAHAVPVTPPAPVEAPVPDIHVAVSSEAVDAVIAAAPDVVRAEPAPEESSPLFDEQASAGDKVEALLREPLRPGVGMSELPAERSAVDMPDHLVFITLPLNRRAFAELERMAAAGLHGDNPGDVARTLVLDGLRRWALVRP